MKSASWLHPFLLPRYRVAAAFCAVLGLVILLGVTGVAYAYPGNWSPAPTTSRDAVHMTLLPGDSANYHSRILMWGETSIHNGTEFGWNPNSPDTASCAYWPYPGLVTLLSDSTWNPQANVLCAGHAQLATGAGLLTVGGDDGATELGIPDALKFTPGIGASAGSWSQRADMQQSRFYPALTTLRDGRMLVTGGLRYQHEWYFGGRVDTIPPSAGTGDSLYRFGSGAKRIWDPPVKPLVTSDSTDRPSPREGHTAVNFALSASTTDMYQAFFGGKDGSGHTVDNAVHLLKRENGGALDADYTYRWSKLAMSGSDLPFARSDHVAINLGGAPDAMVIYGGLRHPTSDTTIVLGDFLKLSKVGLSWQWTNVSASGTDPGPRYGHTAASYGGKMYVFGGSGAAGADPADNHVYKFDFSSGQWSKLPTAAGAAPGPRRDHAMVAVEGTNSSLLMYGGYLTDSTSSDTLWKLVPGDSARWSVITSAGSSPGPRADHTAFFDGLGSGRLTVFGGRKPRSGDPSVDNYAYSIHPFDASPTWIQEPGAQYHLSGQTVCGDPFEKLHARIPEIYDAEDNVWTPQTSSGWMPPAELILEYPVQFLVPGTSIPGGGGRVLRVGQDPATRYLDVPVSAIAGAWRDTATNVISGNTLHASTGVQYLPGKILVVGNGPEGTDATDNRARSFDIATYQWVDRPGMAERNDPNILMLPNGKVFVEGGNTCPQIWDPNTGSWTAYSPCGLTAEPVSRGYHSTAMLLPDGRVLTGGAGPSSDASLHVFCPPYLFSSDSTLATRPTLASLPSSVVYGESFLIGKAKTDSITSACLIRPAAVTHSFDQNGRYVPLTIESVADSSKLRVYAPLSGSAAPPGDYLLFILNDHGVPAIAKWIHLGNCSTIPCDTDSPPAVTSSSMYVDIVGPNEIWLAWDSPGDETTPVSGGYDLRYATSAISTETAYAAATQASGEPSLYTAGYPTSCAVYGLAACTPYSFAVKALDGFGNLSARSDPLPGSTTCGGSGGTESAQRAPSLNSASTAGNDSTSVASDTTATENGVLVAETARTAGGGWQVTLSLATGPDGVSDADAGAIVSQVRVQDGGWRTLGRFTPTAGQSPLGVCALRDQGRVVFPAGYGLAQVSSALQSGGQRFTLTSAEHSRFGALGDSVLATPGAIEMAVGDALKTTYATAAVSDNAAFGWYLLVRPGGATRTASALHSRPADLLPRVFALHAARPNPARGATVIPFDLPKASAVRLEVFDLLGRRVRVLAARDYPAGVHNAAWDGRQDDGAAARGGVYFYRMTAGTFRAKRAMVLLSK